MRARAAVLSWAAALAILLQEASPEAIQTLPEGVQFSWHETLGVPPNADATMVRRAIARLALACHPDKGGAQEQMARINAAYVRARPPHRPGRKDVRPGPLSPHPFTEAATDLLKLGKKIDSRLTQPMLRPAAHRALGPGESVFPCPATPMRGCRRLVRCSCRSLLGPLIVPDCAARARRTGRLSHRAAVYATHARDGTRRAYRAAWRQHEAWCRAARAQTARRPLS